MKTDIKGFDYDSKYFNCLEDHWSVVSFSTISKFLEKGLLISGRKINISNVLDLGCGNGIYGQILKEYSENVYGIDISEISVERSMSTNNYTNVLKENVTDGLSFEQDFFDIIFSTEVIEHIEDLDSLFKELRRILKKEGMLILTTTMYFSSLNCYSKYEHGHSFFQVLKVRYNYLLGFFNRTKQREFVLQYCFEKLGGHYHGFHKKQLISILEKYGFKVINHNYFFPFDPINFPFIYTDFKALLRKPFPKNIITFFLFIPFSLMNKIFRIFNIGANNIFIVAQMKA